MLCCCVCYESSTEEDQRYVLADFVDMSLGELVAYFILQGIFRRYIGDDCRDARGNVVICIDCHEEIMYEMFPGYDTYSGEY